MPRRTIGLIRNGTLPRSERLDIARGVHPLFIGQDELMFQALALLSEEVDSEIKDRVSDTLRRMPMEILLGIANDRNADNRLLKAVAVARIRDRRIVERLLLNRSTSDDIFIFIAERAPRAVQELILFNQERLTREPGIIKALLKNPNLDPGIEHRLNIRIAELKAQGVIFDTAETPSESVDDDLVSEAAVADFEEEPPPEADEDDEDYLARYRRIIGEKKPESRTSTATEGVVDLEALRAELEDEDEDLDWDEELEEIDEDDDKGDLTQKLRMLPQIEKIRLAKFGGASVRSVLIRDTSKPVALEVLKSPKLSEGEIEGYANMRTIDSDILRQIAGSREWSKYYGIIRALSFNPKTPFEKTVHFMQRLSDSDLKSLEQSRELPGALRAQAKKWLIIRQKKREFR